MPDRHLVEVKVASQELVKGNFLHTFRDTVKLPDGKLATREFVVHPGAVIFWRTLLAVSGWFWRGSSVIHSVAS
jgi:hypothetical protein